MIGHLLVRYYGYQIEARSKEILFLTEEIQLSSTRIYELLSKVYAVVPGCLSNESMHILPYASFTFVKY